MKLNKKGLLIQLEPEDKITEHFKFKEFCKRDVVPFEHYGDLIHLCRLLEHIRAMARVSLQITSGYRSPEHNREVADSDISQHSFMRAVDFRPVLTVPVDVANRIVLNLFRDLKKNAKLLSIGGLGYYKENAKYPRARIHVDQRPIVIGQSLVTWEV